jgi:hypothetical protein
MDSDKKDKKLPYEPPRIYELEVDMAQAMGQSVCNPNGNRAGGLCNNGNRANNACNDGNRARTECDGGSSGAPPPPPTCETGDMDAS